MQDNVYAKVMKDICFNRSNQWQLKPGADF
jgi:hypothetical protein